MWIDSILLIWIWNINNEFKFEILSYLQIKDVDWIDLFYILTQIRFPAIYDLCLQSTKANIYRQSNRMQSAIIDKC